MDTSPLQLLIVEDEPIIALHLHQIVTQLGYVVLATVASGEEAVQHAQALRPDLVLMDIGLQGAMDGITVAEHLWRAWQIPSLFITAYSDAGTLGNAARAKPLGYIRKPFEEHDIEATLKRACVHLQGRDPMHTHDMQAEALRLLRTRVRELAEKRLSACAEDQQLVEAALTVAVDAVRLAISALNRATNILRQA
jgi:CheY-like chemotaxis protein